MKAVTLLLLLAGAGIAAGCSDSAVLEPPEEDAGIAARPAYSSAAVKLGVITRNLYVGTDVDAVISALRTSDPGDDLPALFEAIETLQRTDFPARVAAIADEIARARPHAVGLQEVSRIDLIIPPFGVDIHQDFLPTLLAELKERDLDYDVAAQIKNIEAAPFEGVSLVDFDVLLVRHGIDVRATSAQNFAVNLGTVAEGVILKRLRARAGPAPCRRAGPGQAAGRSAGRPDPWPGLEDLAFGPCRPGRGAALATYPNVLTEEPCPPRSAACAPRHHPVLRGHRQVLRVRLDLWPGAA